MSLARRALLSSAVLLFAASPLRAAGEPSRGDDPGREAETRDDRKAAEDGAGRGWGEVIDPDGDCGLRFVAGKVEVTVPGTAHDLAAETETVNAPPSFATWKATSSLRCG